jgi:hypothetical protein
MDKFGRKFFLGTSGLEDWNIGLAWYSVHQFLSSIKVIWESSYDLK